MEQTQGFCLDAVFDPYSYQTIAESPVSYVVKGRLQASGETVPQWYAIKSATTRRELSKKPHDILKELRILLSLSHPNIIEVIGHGWEAHTSTVHFWMPFISYDLFVLLSSPEFSPHSPNSLPSLLSSHKKLSNFLVLAKSIVFQILWGVSYLHERRIAHRDIKPRNILIDERGRVKIIDFGIAWTDVEELARNELWPEPPGKMVFDVSTGPYRAPELLFGAHTYDPVAIDLWSLGVVLAEFFTPLELEKRFDDFDEPGHESEDSEDEQNKSKPAFVVPDGLSLHDPDTIWTRESLLDGGMGTIGLAWSIFKTLGTPNEESWPEFNELPDANKVTFRSAPPTPLETLLPNLPPAESSRGGCVELVQSFLQYSPRRRLKAADALQSRWLVEGWLLLPLGYPLDNISRATIMTDWEGQTLGDLLSSMLSDPTRDEEIMDDLR